jgi:hypothetical protein
MNGKSYKIYYDVNYTVLSVGVVNLRKRLVKGIGMDSANHVFVSYYYCFTCLQKKCHVATVRMCETTQTASSMANLYDCSMHELQELNQ